MSAALDWFGPVTGRELLQIARRRRFYVLRFAYGLLLLYLAFAAWSDSAQGRGLHAMAAVASVFVESLVVAQILACGILAAVSLCDAIASERRSRNLEIWRTTPLAAEEIVRGKLLSHLACSCSILASGWPVVALLAFFGGVSFPFYVGFSILALVVGGVVGSCALMFSARTHSGLRALLGVVVRLIWVGFLIQIVLVGTIGLMIGLMRPMRSPNPVFEEHIAFVVVGGVSAFVGYRCFLGAAIRAVRGNSPDLSSGATAASRSHLPLRDDADELDPAGGRNYQLGERFLERFFGRRNPLWSDARLEVAASRPPALRLKAYLAANNGLGGCLMLLVSYFVLGTIAILIALASNPNAIFALAVIFAVLQWLATFPLLCGIAVQSTTAPLLDRRQDLWSLLRITDLTSAELVRGAWLSQWPTLLPMLTLYGMLGVLALPGALLEGVMRLVLGTLTFLLVAAWGLLLRLPERQEGTPLAFIGLVIAATFGWPVCLLTFGNFAFGLAITAPPLVLAALLCAKLRPGRVHAAAAHAIAFYIATTATAGIAFQCAGGSLEPSKLSPWHWTFAPPSRINDNYDANDSFDAFGPIFAIVLVACLLWTRRYAIARFEAFADQPRCAGR